MVMPVEVDNKHTVTLVRRVFVHNDTRYVALPKWWHSGCRYVIVTATDDYVTIYPLYGPDKEGTEERIGYVYEFLEECTVMYEGAKVRGSELYRAYLEWCDKNNRVAVGRKTFYKVVSEREGVVMKKISNAVHFIGICLRR